MAADRRSDTDLCEVMDDAFQSSIGAEHASRTGSIPASGLFPASDPVAVPATMTQTEVTLRQADGPTRVAIARALFREYAVAIGTDLEYQGFSDELAALPTPYVPPNGALLIAEAGADVAGCVALRPLGAGVGEMKRLYVRPAYRSWGLGQRLVEAVIAAAREAGHRELRLDTLASMASAQALYGRLGFAEIPAYNTTHLAGTRFYALELSA